MMDDEAEPAQAGAAELGLYECERPMSLPTCFVVPGAIRVREATT